jgi:hypothetical protein
MLEFSGFTVFFLAAAWARKAGANEKQSGAGRE